MSWSGKVNGSQTVKIQIACELKQLRYPVKEKKHVASLILTECPEYYPVQDTTRKSKTESD